MDYHEYMKRYYDRRASEYELNEAFREEPSEDLPRLLHAISILPPARVLDVACGTGFLTQHLGSEVTGLDQSEAMLEVARRRVPWAEFVRGDAFRMPFAEDSFDRVFASFFYGLLPLEDRGSASRLPSADPMTHIRHRFAQYVPRRAPSLGARVVVHLQTTLTEASTEGRRRTMWTKRIKDIAAMLLIGDN